MLTRNFTTSELPTLSKIGIPPPSAIHSDPSANFVPHSLPFCPWTSVHSDHHPVEGAPRPFPAERPLAQPRLHQLQRGQTSRNAPSLLAPSLSRRRRRQVASPARRAMAQTRLRSQARCLGSPGTRTTTHVDGGPASCPSRRWGCPLLATRTEETQTGWTTLLFASPALPPRALFARKRIGRTPDTLRATAAAAGTPGFL